MRRIVALLTVAALMALMLMVSALPAFAVASSQASCAGIGNSTETALEGPGSSSLGPSSCPYSAKCGE